MQHNLIIATLKDTFVCGFGISTEFPYVEFAKRSGSEVFRLWIDCEWKINPSKNYQNLTEDEFEILELNRLRSAICQNIAYVERKELTIHFDDGKKIFFDLDNTNDGNEKITLYQINPIVKAIWIEY
ncbi:hypothetical protein [Neolewinella litorea]|uniref:Uncharacterized protein n=1 Tax=Neolewinella litorea TaxID=2562452 RepID=A0A4S4N8M0_9BACT|nr:hypothetical protein [Neolewinella litorea]THH34331.1 hypothetical protein E4021_17825 [Neolewinella litorea]